MSTTPPNCATVTNSLLRCTRSDDAATPVFERVREDLDLYVLELVACPGEVWASQVESIIHQLERNRPLLSSLSKDSGEFTLHLAAATNEFTPLHIPVRLSRLAAECGFTIEISIDNWWDEEK